MTTSAPSGGQNFFFHAADHATAPRIFSKFHQIDGGIGINVMADLHHLPYAALGNEQRIGFAFRIRTVINQINPGDYALTPLKFGCSGLYHDVLP